MRSIVPLLAVVTLLSSQCSFGESAFLGNRRNQEMDNDLVTNFAIPAPKRRLGQYVHIASAPPKVVRAVRGEALVLKCEIYGAPSPTVAWLRNGQVLIDYEEEANEIFLSHPTSLGRLTAKLLVSEPRNGDVYICHASAGLKQQSASTTILTVGEEDNFLNPPETLFRGSSKPLITVHYNELFQNIGTSVVLPCRVQSDINVQVYWTDNDDAIIYNNAKFKILPSGDLFINSLQWSDMGQFTCTVKNVFGSDRAETFLYPMKP